MAYAELRYCTCIVLSHRIHCISIIICLHPAARSLFSGFLLRLSLDSPSHLIPVLLRTYRHRHLKPAGRRPFILLSLQSVPEPSPVRSWSRSFDSQTLRLCPCIDHLSPFASFCYYLCLPLPTPSYLLCLTSPTPALPLGLSGLTFRLDCLSICLYHHHPPPSHPPPSFRPTFLPNRRPACLQILGSLSIRFPQERKLVWAGQVRSCLGLTCSPFPPRSSCRQRPRPLFVRGK